MKNMCKVSKSLNIKHSTTRLCILLSNFCLKKKAFFFSAKPEMKQNLKENNKARQERASHWHEKYLEGVCKV